MIEESLNDPILLAGAGVIIVVIFLINRFQSNDKERINAENMEQRLKKILVMPSIEHGTSIKDWVKIRSTSTASSTLGLAVKTLDNPDVKVQAITDKGEIDEQKIPGSTYSIIPGKRKVKVYPKYYILKYLKFNFLMERWLRTYDIPSKFVITGDEFIHFTRGHFVEFNGVYRLMNPDGMQRVWELSFSKVHENYLDASQKIPEQYATLNNRISGDIKLENIKSENIRKYTESKNRSDKKDAMKD